MSTGYFGSLQEAFDKLANKAVREEVESLQEDFGWSIDHCLEHACDTLDHSRAAQVSIKRIYALAGYYRILTQAEYDSIEMLGGDKRKEHPLINGYRHEWVGKPN